ncbi:MAG: hypothetical protein ACPHVT_07585, partial [Porticoccaceae bacterium]
RTPHRKLLPFSVLPANQEHGVLVASIFSGPVARFEASQLYTNGVIKAIDPGPIGNNQAQANTEC